MSGNKGVPHRALDEIAKIDARLSGKQNELIKKHNDMSAQLAAIEQITQQIAAFTASEMGKFQAAIQNQLNVHGRGIAGVDFNVLALSEIVKELAGQITKMDTIFAKVKNTGVGIEAFDLTDAELIKVKEDSESWYQDLLTFAFTKSKATLDKMAEEEKAKQEAEQQAAMEAAKANVDAIESAAMNTELKNADMVDRALSATTSGGPGSQFPEGADIFGG